MSVEPEAPLTVSDLMWSIYHHVRQEHDGKYEGGSSVEEAAYLLDLARTERAVVIGEIGFNMGFSALAFLESSPDARVVSFELDERPSVRLAKEFIDQRYPGRHELVIGDSLTTVPRYAERHGGCLDLVFVDGGHEYEVAIADIRNGARSAKAEAIVVVDDIAPWWPWGVGPAQAWYESVDAGLIEPIRYHLDGNAMPAIEGRGDRAWATGRFTT